MKIQNFSFMKMHLKILFAKWWPFCPGEDELMYDITNIQCHYVYLSTPHKCTAIYTHENFLKDKGYGYGFSSYGLRIQVILFNHFRIIKTQMHSINLWLMKLTVKVCMIYIWSNISGRYWKQQCNQLCQYTIAETWRRIAQWNHLMRPGPHLNIKTVFPRYGDSHVKHKTVSETVLSLTWESLYWEDNIFILRRPPGPHLNIKTVFPGMGFPLYR